MKSTPWRLGIPCLLLVFNSAEAKIPYQTMSLNDAVDLALRFNPQLEIAGLNRLIQKYNLRVVKNQYEWHYALNASSQYTWLKNPTYTQAGQTYDLQPSATLNVASGATINTTMNNVMVNPNGIKNASSYNPGISVDIHQPLMRGFGPAVNLSPLANAIDQEKINQLNLKQAVINTIVQVALAYENVILAKQTIHIQQMTVADVKQRIHDNSIRIHAGIMPPGDNIQATADLANAQLGLNAAQYAYTQSRLAFLNDVGVSPHEPLDVKTTLDNPIHPLPTLANIQAAILANDGDYQRLIINHRINQRNWRVATDDQRSQVDLTLTGISGNNSGIANLVNGAHTTAAIGLNVSIPIDDVRLKQRVLTAKMQLSQDTIHLKAQQWLLASSGINALNNLKSLQTQLILAKNSVDQQQKTLIIAAQKLHFGLGSALDLSTQQKNLTQAQLIYSSSQINYFNTWLQFRQLTGETLNDFHITIRY